MIDDVILKNYGANCIFLKSLSGNSGFAWLGAHNLEWTGVQWIETENWVWTDGTPWGYESWYPTQPGNEREDENYIFLHPTGAWYDSQNVPVASVPGFICQYPFERFEGKCSKYEI